MSSKAVAFPLNLHWKFVPNTQRIPCHFRSDNGLLLLIEQMMIHGSHIGHKGSMCCVQTSWLMAVLKGIIWSRTSASNVLGVSFVLTNVEVCLDRYSNNPPFGEWAFSSLDFTADWISHLALAIYMFVVFNFDALAHTSIHACMHASYIHTLIHTYSTYVRTYVHTYTFIVVNFDALAQASDIRIERRQVVFLCWRQDSNPSGSQTPNRQQTECPLTNRLSYRGSSKNLNSTARPYDQWAFSPLDPTAVWHSHLALAIYMFIVVNFDALAQASDFRSERRQVVFLCWRQDSNPSGSQTPNRQQTECPLTNRLSYRGSSKNLNSTIHTYIYIHAYMHAWMHGNTHTPIHACMHAYTHNM